MCTSLVDELGARLVSLEPDDIVEPVAAPRPSATAPSIAPPTIATAAGLMNVVGRLVIGRVADVAVHSPLVSRRHAELWTDGDALLCRDLGSTNGTMRVRDNTITAVGTGAATLLLGGDVLVTADGVELLRVLDT